MTNQGNFFVIFLSCDLFIRIMKLKFFFSELEKIVVVNGWIDALYQTAVIVSNCGRGVQIHHSVINMVVMLIWVTSRIFYILLLGLDC